MRLKKRKECLFFLLFAFLIFGIFQYSIHKIFGMVYFPDEFGYWASAAKWNGYAFRQCYLRVKDPDRIKKCNSHGADRRLSI